jgi:hypothetical protein
MVLHNTNWNWSPSISHCSKSEFSTISWSAGHIGIRTTLWSQIIKVYATNGNINAAKIIRWYQKMAR